MQWGLFLPILCKHIDASFWKKIRNSVFTRTFISIFNVNRLDDVFFIWKRSKEQFIQNLDELNKKRDSTKFEFKISKISSSLLDIEVYIKNNKLYTKIYRKQTNRQSFHRINSEHQKSLKDSISYSEALQIKRNCTSKDFEHHCKKLKERFLKKCITQSYQNNTLNQLRNLIRTS